MKNVSLLVCIISLNTVLRAQSWERLTPAASTSIAAFEPPYTWSLMSAVDADTVWFADRFGRVTRTADGGRTWKTSDVEGAQDLRNSYYIGSIHAADAQQAFVILLSFGGASRITLRTTDGGTTWKDAFSNGEFSQLGSFLNGIHFFNPRTALAWGDTFESYRTTEFYRTTNGGDTWTKVTLLPPFDSENIDHNAFDAVGDTIWIGTLYNKIFKSNDQGATWALSQLPVTGIVSGVALTNGREGAINSGSDVYSTSDGGAQWTLRTRRSVNSFNSNQIFSVKGTTSIFVAANQFDGWADMSFDTCKTWGISLLQPGTLKISDLKFINARQAWAAQGDSVVLKWKNPTVLFDPVEPDYTSVKAKHANDVQTSGARLALWSGTSASYQVQHTLLKDGVAVATTSESRTLTPRTVASSFSTTPLSGKGIYTLRTRLEQNNTLVQQHTAQLVASDSIFSKDSDRTIIYFGSNRGNFFDLAVADTLTSISAKLDAYEPTSVRFWVFDYNPTTRIYRNRLHYSDAIPLIPKDTLFIFGNDSIKSVLPLDLVVYSLPQPLALSAGRYAIGVQFAGNSGLIQMDAHKVSSQAILAGNTTLATSPTSRVGYAYAPSIRANFNFERRSVPTWEPDLAAGIRVFPNPARERVSFDLPATLPERLGNAARLQLKLFNMNGQEVYNQWLTAGVNTLFIAPLPTGIYTWQLTGSNGRRVVGNVVVHP